MGDGEQDRELRGHFFGSSNDGAVNVRIELELRRQRSRWAVRSLAGTEPAIVDSDSIAVSRHLRQLEALIERENRRNRPIRAVPKPAKNTKRRRHVEAMVCPDCLGFRSFDCSTCEGAGRVPAS
jgi:hypothetical protein